MPQVAPFVRGPLLGGILALLACGCGVGDSAANRSTPDEGRSNGGAITLTDDAGRSVVLPAPPDRVVSLVPSATGILIALGVGDRLVARTDFDEAPEVSSLPSVGGGLAPSMERIVSLDPDLVVLFRAESDEATPRLLDRAGIAYLAVRPDGIEDVERIVRLLGDAVARPAVADSIVLALTHATGEIAARVAGRERPRVAYLLGGDPPLVASGGTFLHELVELAGGDNVFENLAILYAPVSVEEILRRNVDVVLIGEGNAVPFALRGHRIVRLPASVEIPGLGLAVSARRIAEALHPDRFP